MNNFEFISYKIFPEDQYIEAMARVRVDRKHVYHFVKKKLKDGGIFWTRASHAVVENGEKKYFKDYMSDSLEEELLIEFVREKANAAAKAATNNVQMQGQVHYPHGMAQSKTSMSEVVENEQLSF